MRRFRNIVADENGQDLTEYGLLAAFISVAAVITVRSIGPLVTPLYVLVENAF